MLDERTTFYSHTQSRPISSRSLLNWVAIAIYVVGLFGSFFVSHIFQAPPAILWSFAVFMFCILALFLGRPEVYAYSMILYYCLMPAGRLLGVIPLPVPGIVDQLIFLPPLAVIGLSMVERKTKLDVTPYPWLFLLLAVLSWYANGKQYTFSAVQVVLVCMKFFIVWWFVRLTGCFRSEKQCLRWTWLYIGYAAFQYVYNIFWQRGFYARIHPDRSSGIIGGSTGGAHQVGYMSVFALFMLAGWYISKGHSSRLRTKVWALVFALIITYDLVFMTDTKHVLLFFPIAVLPFVFHPHLPSKIRSVLYVSGTFVIIASIAYLSHFLIFSGGVSRTYKILMKSAYEGGKGVVFQAVTKDFSKIVRYPLLGAGPATFTSGRAVSRETPLARTYIVPFKMMAHREALRGNIGTTPASSVIGMAESDLHAYMGEFGWLGALLFYSFQIWASWRLFLLSCKLPLARMEAGLALALSSCLLCLTMISLLIPIYYVGMITYTLWAFIGKVWDIPHNINDPKKAPAIQEAT